MVAHRPAIDDAGYVSIAVDAADNPSLPLLGRDHLHGLPDTPAALQIYKTETLEQLWAVSAHATGLHVLDFAHVILPAIAAFLSIFAFARLFRTLVPGRWMIATVTVIFVLLLSSNTHRAVGNFAFVRLHHGKAVFLTALVPLLIVFAIEFAIEPSLRRWLHLAAAQVASVGLTSTAIWLAPAIAGLGLVCGLQTAKSPLRNLILGLTSSSQVVVIGLWLWSRLDTTLDHETVHNNADLMKISLHDVLGTRPMIIVVVLAILAVSFFGRSMLERRFAIVFSLGFCLFWNPFTARWIAENVTHPITFWRVLWVLPIPILVAVAATIPIEMWLHPGASTRARAVVTLALTGIILASVSPTHTLSPQNGVRLGRPTWKVPLRDFSAADRLARQVTPGTTVIAPFTVAPWVVTMHSHPQPLVVRRGYLGFSFPGDSGAEERKRRTVLARFVSGLGAPGKVENALGAAIGDYSIEGICFVRDVVSPEVESLLRESGMQKAESCSRYDIWTKIGQHAQYQTRRALFRPTMNCGTATVPAEHRTAGSK
jgi:hypothetical protein